MNRETEMWHEDIADLWTGQLQHLRDRNYSITYDPSPVAHGFGDVHCIESGLEEDIQIFDVHSKEQPPPLIQLIDPETSDDGKQSFNIFMYYNYMVVHYYFKFQFKQF